MDIYVIYVLVIYVDAQLLRLVYVCMPLLAYLLTVPSSISFPHHF
jgi:hypothetical protein